MSERMRALLDVNVLIALIDPDHRNHVIAAAWFARNAGAGWASCPLTQNGALRIMSSKGYANRRSVVAVMAALRTMCATSQHAFWPDDLSILDAARFESEALHRGDDITDVYLLALAVGHGGRLVTLDRAVSTNAVVRYAAGHLEQL